MGWGLGELRSRDVDVRCSMIGEMVMGQTDGRVDQVQELSWAGEWSPGDNSDCWASLLI